ncbi:MAG TPA: sigma-70 family RNA polymerase sigma factor, partial [Rhodothermales bacterium]|nr:sigma-70 family RNA polymerase sigma factor [Rhodothermales bacterium]
VFFVSEAITKHEVTQLLVSLGSGDRSALDRLMPLVYMELRRLAKAKLGSERSDHTLNTTALVHEAYIKLADQHRINWQSRGQFFALASQAMRRILVDYARRRNAAKRGGNAIISIREADSVASEVRADALVALDESLQRLAEMDPRQSQIVECRFFGGLSIEETAEVVGVSTATVKREWAVARAWLYRELNGEVTDEDV